MPFHHNLISIKGEKLSSWLSYFLPPSLGNAFQPSPKVLFRLFDSGDLVGIQSPGKLTKRPRRGPKEVLPNSCFTQEFPRLKTAHLEDSPATLQTVK
jgi:hypothetical protein